MHLQGGPVGMTRGIVREVKSGSAVVQISATGRRREFPFSELRVRNSFEKGRVRAMNALLNNSVYGGVQARAEALAAKAKDGTALVDGERYTLTFDRREWVYDVRDAKGTQILRINEKTLSAAKRYLEKWLRI
jgi:hypothetical protein